jgi:hypothetical protein
VNLRHLRVVVSNEIVRIAFKGLKLLDKFFGVVENPGNHVGLKSHFVKTVVEESNVEKLVHNILPQSARVLLTERAAHYFLVCLSLGYLLLPL